MIHKDMFDVVKSERGGFIHEEKTSSRKLPRNKREMEGMSK